jgi:hypothetical protein
MKRMRFAVNVPNFGAFGDPVTSWIPRTEAGATWWHECVWPDQSDDTGPIIGRVESGTL